MPSFQSFFTRLASVIVCLTLWSCDKQPKEDSASPSQQKSDGTQDKNSGPETLDQAIQTIKDHPNLEFIKVNDGKILFKNKHVQLELELTPEQIAENKHDLLASQGPDSAIIKAQKEAKERDWGKTPQWIPRYPDAMVRTKTMHYPMQDGSIYGNVNLSHTDSIEEIVAFYKPKFTKEGLAVTSGGTTKGSRVIVFQNKTDAVEKRRIVCNLKRDGDVTKFSIQYSYGMP